MTKKSEDSYKPKISNVSENQISWLTGISNDNAHLVSESIDNANSDDVDLEKLRHDKSEMETQQLGDLFSENIIPNKQSNINQDDRKSKITGKSSISITGNRQKTVWGGYQDLEKVWPVVDQLRNFVSTDAPLQSKVKELVLTQDSDINSNQRNEIMEMLTRNLAARGGINYQPEQMGPALDLLYDEIIGISVLGELWRDDSITEILVDRWDRVSVEANGKLVTTSIRFRDSQHANDVARSLALRVSDRAVSQKNPLVTAELPQARVTICYGPIVQGGLSITIRKFRPLLNLKTILDNGSLNSEMVELLKDLVLSRASILVSGGTGTGKTTIINLLSNFIPETERVVTIEDSFELSLMNKHVVSLQTKESASIDDQVSVGMADLLRSSLRMRPDRIIIGEIREGEGARTMLSAANTGHDGTMTTIHANSPTMALNERLTDLMRETRAIPDDVAKRTIASAFDIIVQVSKSIKGVRYISEISMVDVTMLSGGQIQPKLLFIGTESSDGSIQFSRKGVIDKNSGLYKKIASSIVNPSRWS